MENNLKIPRFSYKEIITPFGKTFEFHCEDEIPYTDGNYLCVVGGSSPVLEVDRIDKKLIINGEKLATEIETSVITYYLVCQAGLKDYNFMKNLAQTHYKKPIEQAVFQNQMENYLICIILDDMFPHLQGITITMEYEYKIIIDACSGSAGMFSINNKSNKNDKI